jgi:hypothetical protein
MSMLLYALSLNPLLTLLDTHLRGVHIGPRRHKYTSVVYADDVTVILADMAEVEILEGWFRIYERATGGGGAVTGISFMLYQWGRGQYTAQH